MKIGINFNTHDEYISGVDYYSLGLIESLLSLDTDNQYVVYTNSPYLLNQYTDRFTNLKIYSINSKTRGTRIFFEHFRLPFLVKKHKLNLLHCPHYITPLVKLGIPYVVTVHDTFALDNPEWCKLSNRLNYKLFMPRTSFKADAIIAVSKQTCQKIIKHNPQSDPSVIYPGIDDCFNTGIDQLKHQKVKTKYKLPERYFLYVGNIEPKKNIINLLKAYKLLKSRQIEHKLVIVGKRTWNQGNVWDYIHANFKPKDIVLTGYADRDDLPYIYQLAQACVSPSLSEGFGFPALEAMRCGTPVIASPVGILKELPSETYCRIDPTDVTDIALKLLSMIARDNTIQMQIDLALKETRRFSWQKCAAETLNIYRQLAG